MLPKITIRPIPPDNETVRTATFGVFPDIRKNLLEVFGHGLDDPHMVNYARLIRETRDATRHRISEHALTLIKAKHERQAGASDVTDEMTEAGVACLSRLYGEVA